MTNIERIIAQVVTDIKTNVRTPQELEETVDTLCTQHGTEYVAEIMMNMPEYDYIKNVLDTGRAE